MPGKKRNLLIKAVWGKKRVTSMNLKLVATINVDRSSVNMVLRDASCMRYNILSDQKLSPAWGWNRGRRGHVEKTMHMAENVQVTAAVWPAGCSGGPSCCLKNFLFSRIFGGVLKQKVDKGDRDPQMKRFREGLGSVSGD